MMKKFKNFILFAIFFCFVSMPSFSFAQQLRAPSGLCTLQAHPKLGDLFGYITCIISRSVIPLIFAIAVASFVWGVVQYVINTNDEAKKAKGRQFMLWGIIALAVMVSVWGLVRILGTTFNIQYVIPQLQQ